MESIRAAKSARSLRRQGLIAKAAQEKIAAGANGKAETMNAKLVTATFFMQRMLPETAAHLARIQAGADTTMGLSAEAF